MQTYAETAYAKINLALHVRGRRPDGYHELETLFAFVDDGDQLTVSPSSSLTLAISGPFAQDLGNSDDNLVLRASKLLQTHFKIERGAALTLHKSLPVSSGIGGGSADAAAAARLLNRFWQLGADHATLAALLAPLGADIPACVASVSAFGIGTGTTLLPVERHDLSGLPVLLVNPLKPLATADVFAHWDGIDRGALCKGNPREAALQGRNDLETTAIEICPIIADVLKSLQSTQPVLARMSGSGATCFALYQGVEARDAAKVRVSGSWWTLAGHLR